MIFFVPPDNQMRPTAPLLCDRAMTIVLGTPDTDGLSGTLAVLREWQREGAPMQLHPGDLSWYGRHGTEATADAIRTWSRGGRTLAIGLLDGPGLLRMTIAPDAWQDEELARQLLADVTTPDRGVLPAGEADIEAPTDVLLQSLLAEAGWTLGEPWQPLHRDLTEPVQDPGLRIETTGPERAADWAAVLRAAFKGSTFTAERWATLAAGPGYADGRSLTAYDDRGNPVAVAAVWSAGPGRPGLLEPIGTHPDHRGHGYGKAITLAAAATLRDLGASSAIVNTPSSYVGAVATYRAADFRPAPEIHDRHRKA